MEEQQSYRTMDLQEKLQVVFIMFHKLLVYSFLVIFISACATPKAMDIQQANDDMMSCNELKLAFEKANANEEEAHENKGLTNENT